MQEYDLIIDPELRDHLEAPSSMQDGMLESDLVRCNGPLDPITVWKGRNIIVDGHRRYAICKRKGLPYNIRELEFADAQAVKDWMDILQGSRRNQSPHAHAMLLARRAEAVRRQKVGYHGSSVAKDVAKEHGTTERAVYRAMSYAEAFKKMPRDIQKMIEAQDVACSRKDVIQLADFDEDRIRAIIRSVVDGEFATVGKALRGDGDDSDAEVAEAPEDFDGEYEDAYEDEVAENLDSEPEEEPEYAAEDDSVEDEDDVPPPSKTDTASGMPTKRPVYQVLGEAEKHLGKLVRAVDEVKRSCPARHKGVMTLARQIAELIGEWRDEEK